MICFTKNQTLHLIRKQSEKTFNFKSHHDYRYYSIRSPNIDNYYSSSSNQQQQQRIQYSAPSLDKIQFPSTISTSKQNNFNSNTNNTLVSSAPAPAPLVKGKLYSCLDCTLFESFNI